MSGSRSTAEPLGPSVPAGLAPQVRDFLSYCRVECGFSPATLEAYAADLRELASWLARLGVASWHELDLPVISRHLRHLHDRGLAISSIARHIATIRVFGRFLESNGILVANPAQLLTQPAVWQRLPDVLGVKQVEQLLAAPEPDDRYYLRDAVLLELLYASGLRASEISDLDCDRLYFDLGVARVLGKGAKERIVPVGGPALALTQQYLQELRPKLARPGRSTDRLLLSRSGLPLTRVVVWQIVTKYARRIGLNNVHPHTLRHCFATHLLAGGADLRVVQEMLGHTNIRSTQIYTHVDVSRLKTVIRKHHPRP